MSCLSLEGFVPTDWSKSGDDCGGEYSVQGACRYALRAWMPSRVLGYVSPRMPFGSGAAHVGGPHMVRNLRPVSRGIALS